MSNVLYLDLFSGASGDMLLAALIDAGLPVERLTAELDKLALPGWSIEAKKMVSRGISGTQVHVHDRDDSHPARHLSHVTSLIQSSGLPESVKAQALSAFGRIAKVEAAIHGVPVEKVHFHEIGAVDSLIDIVGFMAGLEALGVERVYASSVPLGSGTIHTEHGMLPVPAPATLAILAEAGAPTRPHPAQTEILTPTAAALLAERATFELPPMIVRRIGYGIGAKELPWANVVRAWLGETSSPEPGQAAPSVTEISCNLDDSDGQELGFAMERLFSAGALDVWFTPIHMKKNRPGVLLSVLANPQDADALAQVLLKETSTLGVRVSGPLARAVCDRRIRESETPWGKVRIKEKLLDGVIVGASAEYEDCARIARENGVPLAAVRKAALRE